MRRYGNYNSVPEDKARCIEEVFDGYNTYQCQRTRGNGPGGLYCKQHGKLADKGRAWVNPEPHELSE